MHTHGKDEINSHFLQFCEKCS